MDRHEKARAADKFAKEYAWNGARFPVQDWFMLAWAREIPELVKPLPAGQMLNLGAGKRVIHDTISLDLESGWDGERQGLDFPDDSCAAIFAHGFFEHISPERVPVLLMECERVLRIGAPLNIVVPHAMAEMYPEDITHKSMWHEATIENILNNPYYDTRAASNHTWRLRVHTTFIMGVVWRNLGLFIQLVKTP